MPRSRPVAAACCVIRAMPSTLGLDSVGGRHPLEGDPPPSVALFVMSRTGRGHAGRFDRTDIMPLNGFPVRTGEPGVVLHERLVDDRSPTSSWPVLKLDALDRLLQAPVAPEVRAAG